MFQGFATFSRVTDILPQLLLIISTLTDSQRFLIKRSLRQRIKFMQKRSTQGHHLTIVKATTRLMMQKVSEGLLQVILQHLTYFFTFLHTATTADIIEATQVISDYLEPSMTSKLVTYLNLQESEVFPIAVTQTSNKRKADWEVQLEVRIKVLDSYFCCFNCSYFRLKKIHLEFDRLRFYH